MNQIFDEIYLFNDQLKKGENQDLQLNVNKIILNYEDDLNIFFQIIHSKKYGINLEFIGLTSNYLFPSVLYNNNFRLEIIKELDNFLKNDYTLNDFQLFLSKKIVSSVGVKKGGFEKSTLEFLRFFLIHYDKTYSTSYEKFEPFLNSYSRKYIRMTKRKLKTKLPEINKYLLTLLIPNTDYFTLPAIFLPYNNNSSLFDDLHASSAGMLYNDSKEKQFLLLFISPDNYKQFKPFILRQITFFENLDLFYQHPSQLRMRNKVTDPFILSNDYQENKFTDSSISFTSTFYNIYRPVEPSHYDTESLIHIFNTSQIPSGFELHPELKRAYSYRNKVVTFYSSINYFIHIFDPRNKKIDRHWQLLELFLKNIFSNGFMIHYRSGIFLSTNAFREDFEPVRRNLIDFIWSFKLECNIYENLNFIPFSFYRLPPSNYFSSSSNTWNFPLFEDKPVNQYFDYLARNFTIESSRLQNNHFKSKITSTIDLLNQEIHAIKQYQANNA